MICTSAAKVVTQSVGPRVAANSGGNPLGVVRGAGRGILAGASPLKLISKRTIPCRTTKAPTQESAPPTPAESGRGRGLLFKNDD